MTVSHSMLFVDVNVLIYAHRPESPDHDRYREWLEVARRADEPLGLADAVLTGFLRIVTNHRIFREPTPPGAALKYVQQLQASPAAIRAVPTDRVWDIFADLAVTVDAKANAIPDSFLAATAIDLNATMITADRGFARFARLRWAHPLTHGRAH